MPHDKAKLWPSKATYFLCTIVIYDIQSQPLLCKWKTLAPQYGQDYPIVSNLICTTWDLWKKDK